MQISASITVDESSTVMINAAVRSETSVICLSLQGVGLRISAAVCMPYLT
jgi:hypothetical protein